MEHTEESGGRLLMPEVTLDPIKMVLICLIGAIRFYQNRYNRAVNLRAGPQGDEFSEVNGFAGEVACAEFLGVDANWTPFKKDNGVDLVSRKGQRVQVKTTHHREGMLVVHKHHKQGSCDIFVLVTGNPVDGIYQIVGWAEEKDLLEKGLQPLGEDQVYFMRRDDPKFNLFKSKNGE